MDNVIVCCFASRKWVSLKDMGTRKALRFMAWYPWKIEPLERIKGIGYMLENNLLPKAEIIPFK